jgi:hypothetical protein
MKKLRICVFCLLSILAVGSTLHAASPAPSVIAQAPVELGSFLATLAPAELPPTDSLFLAASCTQAQCVAKCDCGPAPCVSVCASTVFCICHCEILNPRQRC